jgi:2-polyprenyl-6-methoxyphenol hydroxylase-like FAD-dependent oxidoreductase
VDEPPGGVVRTALIVGAGIGGLAAGIALRRTGWRARIFERAAAPRELGFALNLAPNAVAALRALGVAERIEAEAHRMRVGELRRMDGRTLKRLDIGAVAPDPPSLIALRQTLHGALLDATPAEDLVLACQGVAVERDGERPVLLTVDGRRERGDVLVGADGLGSAIRRHLHPADPPPRDSGLCAVRGVVRGAADPLDGLSGTIYLGRGCEAAAVRASADAIYWYISVRASSLPGASAADADAPAIARLLLDRLPPAFRAVAAPTAPGDLRFDRLVDRDPIARWGDGPVTLLGDAAHPMLPQTGQGAAQALEDAVALGAALAPADAGAAALRDYERARGPRTAALVRRGRRLAAAVAMDGALVDWLRATVIRATPPRVLLGAMLRR